MMMRPVLTLDKEDVVAWSNAMHWLMYHRPPLPPLNPEAMKALEECKQKTMTPPDGNSWRGTGCAIEN